MKQVCQLCHRVSFREREKACKACGMALEDTGKDFCSKACRTTYIKPEGITY